MNKIFSKIINWVLPMCPNGGHRQQGDMVTNINGKSFCWHDECIKANIKDVGDVDCQKQCKPLTRCARSRGGWPCEHAYENSNADKQ